MKRLTAVGYALLVALTVTACDKSTDPSDPNSPQFTTTLLSSNEVPPLPANNPDVNGRGTVEVTINVTRDANQNITAATYNFNVTLSGFPAGTTLTGAHIHNARAGVNSGVVVNLNLASGEIVLANGSGSFTKTGISGTTVDIAQQIINDPAAFYFNVHTTINLGGAVRGQLFRP
jgi:hypothetical protein